jgi:hypothetical protein
MNGGPFALARTAGHRRPAQRPVQGVMPYLTRRNSQGDITAIPEQLPSKSRPVNSPEDL